MARGDFTRIMPVVNWMPDPDDAAMQRAVVFEPGYSDPGPRGPQWCGKHGMNIRFLLRGPKGATQFLMFAGWVPGEKMDPRIADTYPMGADVGWHARVRRTEYDLESSCEYLNGDTCHYDGSGLDAIELTDRFIREGDAAVWTVLREWYDDMGEPG